LADLYGKVFSASRGATIVAFLAIMAVVLMAIMAFMHYHDLPTFPL
jgi:hypothetical protein